MVRLKRCHSHSGFVRGCRLLEDLEEVQTDKVSMEYLLREKLERLVQSEIEARVARMHQVKQTLRVLHDTPNPRCEAFPVKHTFGLRAHVCRPLDFPAFPTTLESTRKI